MRLRSQCILSFMVVLAVAVSGCAEVAKITASTFHGKAGWKAKDYFQGEQVIALCHAIEENDIPRMKAILAAGANPSARGKDNMTPLLWAYPDNKLERFRCLLEHGADPNVIFETDFGAPSMLRAGDAVAHLAARTAFPGYFEAVFTNGGDPLLENQTDAQTPLFDLIQHGTPNKLVHLHQLIRLGADLNHRDVNTMTPAMTAVGFFGQYEFAHALLEAGADPDATQFGQNLRLIHQVLNEGRRPKSPVQQQHYDTLLDWLEKHGHSIEAAQADFAQWEEDRRDPERRRKEFFARQAHRPPADPAIYFDDAQVQALCKAIDANNLAEIERLVAAGANVNAQGRGTMTPLLRALPRDWISDDPVARLATFTRLLELGADPNVAVQTNSPMRADGLLRTDSVTHLAAASVHDGYLQAVLDHRGDPNLLRRFAIYDGDTPIFSVIKAKVSDAPARLRLLLAKGANVNHQNATGKTAAMEAVEWDEQFDCVLVLLEAGLNVNLETAAHQRLAHLIGEKQRSFNKWKPPKKEAFSKVQEGLGKR